MEKDLLLDLELKELVRVDDLYKDGTTFYKSLQKGEGTASPYIDCFVHLRIKIVVDGEEKFSHGSFDNLEEFDDSNSQKYDLEEYKLPSVIRKILKTTKLREVVEVKCSRKNKLVDHLEDSIFKHEYFEDFKD